MLNQIPLSEHQTTTTNISIAFVDPIVSTAYLANKLRTQKITLIAIYTLTDLSEEQKRIRFQPDLFDHVIYASPEQNIKDIANELIKLNCNYVFYGYESSVPFADQISQLVCSDFSNDANTSLYRYDKFAMNEILREKSVSHINQTKIKNDSTLATQLHQIEHWNFPVIVKPTQGSGSIGVKKCNSIQDIQDFLLQANYFFLHSSDKIQDYIIQEYLSGTEYFVDTFSLSGKHQICSVQRYEKISFKGHPVYRYIEMVDPKSPDWKTCSDYVLKVLDAIGLNNGFGHTELILTKTGPALIEVNPRISGISGFINKLTEKTLQSCQPDLLIQSIFHNSSTQSLEFTHFGRVVCLQNWQPKILNELNVNLLSQLSSYCDSVMLKHPETFSDEPQSLLDTIGLVLLANTEESKLLEDYELLISWEKESKLF